MGLFLVVKAVVVLIFFQPLLFIQFPGYVLKGGGVLNYGCLEVVVYREVLGGGGGLGLVSCFL